MAEEAGDCSTGYTSAWGGIQPGGLNDAREREGQALTLSPRIAPTCSVAFNAFSLSRPMNMLFTVKLAHG